MMARKTPSSIARGMVLLSVNLLPPRHRDARLERWRARVWFGICVSCAVLLAGVYGTWSAVWAGDGRDLSAEIAKVTVEIDDNTRASAAIRANINEDRVSLDVEQAITQQPDWSLLLALLSKARGDEIILDRVALEIPPELIVTPSAVIKPEAGGAVMPRNREALFADPSRMLVRLTGYGRSQPALSGFVLRLEALGLFDTVAILKNTREPFLNGEAVAFRVECLIRGGGGAER